MKKYQIAVWCIMWSLLLAVFGCGKETEPSVQTVPGHAEEAEPIAKAVFLYTEETEPIVQTPLKTTLALLGEDHEVGKPLLVRITITNTGENPVHYLSHRVGINASLIVVGPDGENIPYIDASYQTSRGGPPPSLLPGQSKIIVDAVDVSLQYLVVKPGTYSIQYRGQRSKIVAIHNKNHVEVFGWPTIVRIPPSNKLLVEVRRGSPKAADVVATKLFEIMPEHFVLTRYWLEKSRISRICIGPRTKRFVRIIVSLAGTKDLPPQKDNKPRPETEVYLGKSPYGHVFLDIPVQLADAMPDAETKIREALEVER